MHLNRLCRTAILICCLLALAGGALGAESVPPPGPVTMLAWEQQNWESNGGFARLTLWSDGRSEVRVAPMQLFSGESQQYRSKPGWEKLEQPRHLEFIRHGVYPSEVVREKISAALAAGIEQLETFRPDYLDGGGTQIVIQRGRQRQETVIPYFSDADRSSPNYQRFQAVSAVLGGFDRNAFQFLPAQGAR